MKTTYPRKSKFGALGYVLLIAAAGAVSFPIGKDLYHQLTTEDSSPQAVSGVLHASESETGAAEETHQTSKPVVTDFEDSNPSPSGALNEIASADVSNQTSTTTFHHTTNVEIPALEEVVEELPSTASNTTPGSPVPQQTDRHPAMITPGNFTYLGAIRLPHVHGQASRFAYGGHGLTYRHDGDPDSGDDGHPGSLFLVGHRDHEMVAEINIPAPVVSDQKNMDQLPVAQILQPFADLTGGQRSRLTDGSSEPFRHGGLLYKDGKLHWTLHKYYNVSGVDYLSHGVSSSNLQSPNAKGMWHLGPRHSQQSVWHSYKHAGYIAEIPQQVADQFFEGRSLMSGLQIATGLQYSSQGPALYAYAPPGGNEPSGSSLPATPLLWYSMDNPIAQHHHADLWTGASWVTVGGKHAVVIAGRKAHGPIYYGDARPTDCYPDKGYHGSSYEVQLLFYAPAHLLQASKKKVAAVQPWFRWDSNTPGGGIDRFMFQECGREVGGLAYDRKNNLLYLSEMHAGYTSDNEFESLPIIHVFRLSDS